MIKLLHMRNYGRNNLTAIQILVLSMLFCYTCFLKHFNIEWNMKITCKVVVIIKFEMRNTL